VVCRGLDYGDIILTGAAQARRYADSRAATSDDQDLVMDCAARSHARLRIAHEKSPFFQNELEVSGVEMLSCG
jgi:hypothetical protein